MYMLASLLLTSLVAIVFWLLTELVFRTYNRLSARHNETKVRPTNSRVSMLDRLSWWIPKKYREEAVGDLKEDISDMQKAGLSEWQIRGRVLFQLAVLLLSRLNLTRFVSWFSRIIP